ncbi:MAG: mechanosensitive ion channel family protein [Clostridia bacterium]|nr:mechanosensitive ion channel family protein [Clostridia bacterium]
MSQGTGTAGDTLAQEFDHYVDRSVGIFTDLYHQLPSIATRLVLAGLAIGAGILVLRLLRRLINRRSKKKSQSLNRNARQTETVRSLTTSIVSYLLYFLIALVVLRIFGIDLTSLLAVAGIGSIAIGFGAQTLVKDIISGLFLWIEGNLNVGDVVTVAGYNGRVVNMSLRTTTLRATDGSLYAVPNGDIRTVASRSRGNQVAQVNVTVAHGQDLLQAQKILEDECIQLKQRLALKTIPFLYPAIASDARCVTMRIEMPCEADDAWALEREIRLSMFDRLQKEGIKP